MLIEVGARQRGILFEFKNAVEEIVQNVATILTTARGSCPLYREFGIGAEELDAPQNIAQAKLTAEIARQIGLYEPRATLKKIKYGGGKDKLSVIVEVGRADD